MRNRSVAIVCSHGRMNDIIIRPEQTEDFYNTELMTMRSFWNKYFPGCVEHNMLRVIRASADYLPQIFCDIDHGSYKSLGKNLSRTVFPSDNSLDNSII